MQPEAAAEAAVPSLRVMALGSRPSADPGFPPQPSQDQAVPDSRFSLRDEATSPAFP